MPNPSVLDTSQHTSLFDVLSRSEPEPNPLGVVELVAFMSTISHLFVAMSKRCRKAVSVPEVELGVTPKPVKATPLAAV